LRRLNNSKKRIDKKSNLIALITSTIFPSNIGHKEVRSVFSSEERLEQTQATIQSLLKCGYTQIYLLDNSGKHWIQETENKLHPAKVILFHHHQFKNKGISESLMLIDALEYLPNYTPILKISGRYKLEKHLNIDGDAFDLSAKFYTHQFKYFITISTMATRCYLVKDKVTYLAYLSALLEEMYSYSSKIVGLGSLKRFFTNQFFSKQNKYEFFDPTLSVEAASVRVLKKLNFKVYKIEKVGLSGSAGTFKDTQIED
jgi:hypothetical protein